MKRLKVIEDDKKSKHFKEIYIGPLGSHLNCLTNMTALGQRNYHGSKRPGRLIMSAMGMKYDPHKTRFSLSEDHQVSLGLMKEIRV